MKALKWAEDNYTRFKTNILHIQAFFTCLIKKRERTEFDYEKLNELLESAAKSMDKKARDISREMKAEYDFYIKNNAATAIASLSESLKLNPRNVFAFRALSEILKRKKMNFEIME